MEFKEVINLRRSCRSFDPSKKVSKKLIEEIIEAATNAPSWKNLQTSRYYCAISEEAKEKLIMTLPPFNINNSKGASVYLVTTFVKDKVGFDTKFNIPYDGGNGWGYYDLGLNNMIALLKAKELGLDTLVMGIRDGKKIKEILNIPDDEIIVSVIALGYSTKESLKPKRKNIEEIIKFY